MTPLRAIADSIVARGIRHITGRVVAVGDAFPGAVLGYGWSYDDFEDSYSAPIDELLFNEGFSEIHVRGGEHPGDPVQVDVRPGAFVSARARVGNHRHRRRAPDSARRRPNTLRARKDSTTWDIIARRTDRPARYGDDRGHAPRSRRRVHRGRARGAARPRHHDRRDARRTRRARVDTLATLSSPPLSEILKALMKPSQNQIAEMLFRTVALDATGVGSGDSARVVVERQLAQWGAAVPSEAVVRDGSGLSRYDYISPRTIVRVLDAMRRAPTFQVYYDAMPIAGVDGTIRNRMKGTPAQGNVHAKTGSVALARSLSGYVTTANQRMLIFSFLCNNWTVPVREVERVQDAIAARLASMRIQ